MTGRSGQGGDDLAVSLSWPDAASVPDRKPAPESEPRQRVARPAPAESPPPVAPPRRPPPKVVSANETLLDIVEHLNTLSRLVTATTRASTAGLDALGSRVDKAVADFDALQRRILRSLAGFDALRLRVQQELDTRPPLTDDDLDRIADAVTQRLLAHVRVETE